MNCFSFNFIWCDMQYIIIWIVEYFFLKDNLGWRKNGVGFWVNNVFGYGILNVKSMVEVFQNWVMVFEKYICVVGIEGI